MNQLVGRRWAALVGLASAFAVAWAIFHILLTGSCSTPPSDGLPPCPPDTWKYALGMGGGIVGVVVSMIAGGGWAAFYGLFVGIALAGIRAGLSDGGERWFIGFGLCFLIGPAISLLTIVYSGVKKARGQQLLDHGVEAVGTVLSIQDTGVTVNMNPRVRMRFRIEPVGGTMPPFEAEKTTTVSRLQIPHVGDRYPVWFDPSDTSKWAFGAGTPDGSEDPRVRSLWELAKRGARPSFPDRPPQAPPDLVGELNRLNAERLAGRMSADEFARHTAALLGAPSSAGPA